MPNITLLSTSLLQIRSFFFQPKSIDTFLISSQKHVLWVFIEAHQESASNEYFTKKICCGYSSEALAEAFLMSTTTRFCGEIRKILFEYALLPGAMQHLSEFFFFFFFFFLAWPFTQK